MFRHRISQLSFLSKRYNSVASGNLVRVNAIDHDSCFGVPYIDTSLIGSYHTPVIDHLTQQKHKKSFTHDYVMSSSSRQSISLDCFNAICNRNNLVLPVARAVAKSLNAHFDPFLLSDITANKKPGFNVALLKKYAQKHGISIFDDTISDDDLRLLMNEDHTDYCFSEDKINIVYAFMHRMALLHPNALIFFDIYDDLPDSVLNPLFRFYADNSSLIPQNLILSCYEYKCSTQDYSHSSNDLPTLVGTIQGIGKVDPDYYQTVAAMTLIAEQFEGKQPFYKMANYMSSSVIEMKLNATVSTLSRKA